MGRGHSTGAVVAYVPLMTNYYYYTYDKHRESEKKKKSNISAPKTPYRGSTPIT